MSSYHTILTVAACAVVAGVGCSKGAADAAETPQAASSVSAGAPLLPAVNPCEQKLLAPADLEGILTMPITGTKPIPGDAQTCWYTTSGSDHLALTLRLGHGLAAVQMWLDGKMPLPYTPLPGVGDKAISQADSHRIVADKNNLLCELEAHGVTQEMRDPGALAKKLGSLCNKIFASAH